eukprot:tig00020603_g11803.t1
MEARQPHQMPKASRPAEQDSESDDREDVGSNEEAENAEDPAAPASKKQRRGPSAAQDDSDEEEELEDEEDDASTDEPEGDAPDPKEPFLAWTRAAYDDDGFHAWHGPGVKAVDSRHATADAANARVREVFFGRNPWGLGRRELEEEELEERLDGEGLLHLEVCPPDNERWQVAAALASSFMQSDDEDEEGGGRRRRRWRR